MGSVIASNFIKVVSNFLTATNLLKDTRTSSMSNVIAINCAKVVTNTTSFTTADNDNKIAANNI